MRVAKRKRPRFVGVGAVGAMAAGLGGVHSADAAVIHQDVNAAVPPLYDVDLGGDNDPDTNEFDITTFDTVSKVASFSAGTGIIADADGRTANLALNTLIGPASTFTNGGPTNDPLNGTIDGNPDGHFNGTSGFIGVQFLMSGNTHYGYVEYSGVADAAGGTVLAIGWENTPGTAIAAGAVPTAVAGDFDGDGDVDGADFVVWQTNFPKAEGGTLDTGDADGDGDVDGADFVVWQTNFPFTPAPPSAGVTPVPEPTSLGLLAAGAAGLGLYRLRRRSA